jgi:hypothetical protein
LIRRAFGFFGLVAVAALLAMQAAPAGAADGQGVVASRRSSVSSASSAATPKAKYVYTILSHGCPAFNKANIRIRQTENGISGTNYFKQTAQGQVFRAGRWQNRGNASVNRSTQFPNDARSFFVNGPVFTFTWNTEFAFSHRILVNLQWFNNAGTPNFFGDDFVVAKAAVFNRCT